MKYLNGWQRIGIVLSVAWLIGSFVYVRHNQIQHRKDLVNFLFQKCTESNEVADCLKNIDFVVSPANINWEIFFLYCFLPVLSAWVFAYTLISILKWIKGGFENQ